MSEELRPYKIDPNPVPLTDGQRAILDAIPMREPGPIGGCRAQPAAPADAAPSVAPEPVAWTTLIEIDWVKRNAGRAGSFYAVKAGPNDIPLFAHPPRAPLTEEFWLMLDTALDALKYHQEQTRPIELTRVTIAAVETFISAHGIGGK